jgi:hypothetical protein
VDREVLEVTGNGDDSSYWWTSDVGMAPGQRYHFEFRGRRVGGGGSAITGPAFANRDQAGLTDAWQWLGHVFRVPDSGGDGRLRLGHWHATGAIQFDAVRLTPTLPVYRQQGELVLGEGETVRGDLYHFAGTYGHPGQQRPSRSASRDGVFNSDRWVFGANRGDLSIPVARRPADVGRDRVRCELLRARFVPAGSQPRRSDWHLLAEQGALGTARGQVPDRCCPQSSCSFDCGRRRGRPVSKSIAWTFAQRLDRLLPEMAGETVYADLRDSAEHLAIRRIVLQRDPETGSQHLDVAHRSQSGAATVLDARLTSAGVSPIAARDDLERRRLEIPVAVAAGRTGRTGPDARNP